jgi:hypothetical protein
MRCYTQEEIAEEEGIPRTTIEEILTKMADLPESSKSIANHLVDFERPYPRLVESMEIPRKPRHPSVRR